MTAFTSFGFNCADSVNVYFRVGHRYFDPSLANNRAVMNDFVEKVRDAAAAGDIDRIVVYGYASPEGKPRANERLARNRCATIAEYIAAKTGVNRALIEKRPSGIGWNELLSLVESDSAVPCRREVIDILSNTPVWVCDSLGRVVDSRKRQLMNLAGGRPWRWMYKHFFPELRNSVAISLYCRSTTVKEDDHGEIAPEETSPIILNATLALNDSTVAVDSIATVDLSGFVEFNEISETVVPDNDAAGAISFAAPVDNISDSYTPRHLFALKTNLLYYGLLLPNLELEWLINDHWSVALEGNIAWWGSYKNDKSYRMAIIDAEARRWIKPRAPWHGMYVGVIAGGGWYDLERHSRGKYGEGLMTGVSAGYMWPIGRQLSLEAELGVGYIYTRYKIYKPSDGHHVYQRTKDLNYFGPLKLKFSIVWRFFDVNKPRQANKAL